MTIVAFSDTHGKHRSLTLPKGDVLIHAGDVSQSGTKEQVVDFMEWFAGQQHQHKIFIPGNHDFFFEQTGIEEIASLIPSDIIYLNDSGTEIDGVKFWGSPITPWFNDWAFNRSRGAEIKQYWDLIPHDTEVLITHGPPFGILDQTIRGTRTGCRELLSRITHLKPKYHIFGHIHEDYGRFTQGATTFMNVSLLDEWYKWKNQPLCFEF